MVFLRSRVDAWLAHRLGDSSVTNLLPAGTGSIVNTVLPEQSATQYPLLEFHAAGVVVDNCLSTGKQGVEAEYVTQVYHADPEWDSMQALLDAIEARLENVRESYGGYLFDALELAELGGVNTTPGGVLYANGGFRWYIHAEAG